MSSPSKLSPMFIRLCEAYARDMSLYLTGLLQTAMICKALTAAEDCVEEMSGKRLFRNTLRLDGTRATGWILIPESLGNCIVQILLGAPADSDLSHPCAWTELELSLLRGFLTGVVDYCSEGWGRGGGVGFSLLGALQDAAEPAQSHNHEATSIHFNVSGGGLDGNIALAFPSFLTIKEDGNLGAAVIGNEVGPSASAMAVLKAIGKSNLRLEALMEGSVISSAELALLRPGAVLQMDIPDELSIQAVVKGKPLFLGTLEPSPNSYRQLKIRSEFSA